MEYVESFREAKNEGMDGTEIEFDFEKPTKLS